MLRVSKHFIEKGTSNFAVNPSNSPLCFTSATMFACQEQPASETLPGSCTLGLHSCNTYLVLVPAVPQENSPACHEIEYTTLCSAALGEKVLSMMLIEYALVNPVES